MHKYILSIFLFLLLATPALANTTGHAWSESVGWFDFSNAVVTDSALTGYAYNDNTGWLVLSNITNTNGTLSGYAWSESVGWFDFSDVYIESNSLKGYAYNDNTGWLSFDAGTTVATTWTPPVDAPDPEPRRSSSGGSRRVTVPTTTPAVSTPTTLPANLPTTVDGLKALLASLQLQLAQLLSGTPVSSNNPFTRDLQMNSEGEDVTQLQQQLISKGYTIPAGATGFFGTQTQQALIKYQQDNNITPAVGYLGPLTRKALTNN